MYCEVCIQTDNTAQSFKTSFEIHVLECIDITLGWKCRQAPYQLSAAEDPVAKNALVTQRLNSGGNAM